MTINQDDLTRKVQLKALEGLKEVKRICEKHSLNYFFIGGSALGAYRHNGFIPWDDDIDVGMPRKDYEKFIKICESELSAKYYLQTPHKEKIYVFPFTKIRINHTIYRESVVKHIDIHHGVFVDIFPLDDVPDSKLFYNIQKFALNILNHIRVYKIVKRPGFNLKNICKVYPDRLLVKQLSYFLKIAQNKKSSRMGNLLSSYPYGTEINDKNMFAKGKELPFEDITVPIPYYIEDYLTQMYGKDFNELPPMHKRVTHLPSEIKGV